MTERRRQSVHRDVEVFAIGPSALRWVGGALRIDVNEVTVPIPRRLRGRIWVRPESVTDGPIALDPAGAHRWWPVAPRSRVEARFERPDLSWSGSGYFDSNEGDVPLEASFAQWDWSRATVGADTAILYDATFSDRQRQRLALCVRRSGDVEAFEAPPDRRLPATRWFRMPRATQADDGCEVTVQETLEDTPFYARSVLSTHILGQPAIAMHESLSLSRFTKPWVQLMLPFRMPRWG